MPKQLEKPGKERWIINTEMAKVKYWPPGILMPIRVDHMIQSIPWRKEKIRMRGQELEAARKTVDMGDPGLVYHYAGQAKTPLPWSPLVLKIKQEVEKLTGEQFNFAVGNLYESGKDYIGFHRDSTRDLVEQSTIASVSCGAEREMVFKPDKNDKRGNVTITLQSNSLLTMAGDTQKNFKHSIPKRLRVTQPRVNWTFRKVRTVSK